MSSKSQTKILKKIKDVLTKHPHINEAYKRKWNIELPEVIQKLSSMDFHGGAHSKVISLKNMGYDQNLSVLNIGPETGFEVFLLAEVFGKVIVCDPDEDNLSLLKEMVKYYEFINKPEFKFIAAGLNNKETAKRENEIYQSLKETSFKGFPTFYKISSTKEIKDIDIKIDYIFIHKILSTISRSSYRKVSEIFNESVQNLLIKLKNGGRLSWTEPSFLYEQNGIKLNNLKSWVAKKLSVKNVIIKQYYLPVNKELFVQVIIIK